jgi:hypothetical protein
VQPSGEAALIETGDNLGAMTSDLKPSDYIEEFVRGGLKNYAYKIVNSATNKRKTVCKVRGITLNYNASRLVNFDVIRDMILKKKEENVTVHTAKKIKRKRPAGGGGMVSIITAPEDKIYRISFFKRRRLHDETSVPFGYK